MAEKNFAKGSCSQDLARRSNAIVLLQFKRRAVLGDDR